MARRSWARPKGQGRVDSPRFGLTEKRQRAGGDPVTGGAEPARTAGSSAAYRPPSAGDGAQEPRTPHRRRVVPTLTFVLGLLLGAGAVVGLVAAGLIGERAAPAPAPEPSPTGIVLTVPESCAEAGAISARVIDITEQIVLASQELDAARLQVLVDQLQELDPQLRAATRTCNEDSAGSATVT